MNEIGANNIVPTRFGMLRSSLFLLALLLSSCSQTKYVAEGEYWLQSVEIKSDTKSVSPLDMESYLSQKSNYKTLAIFRLPLFIYNLSGRDTTKWYNRLLRNGGEPPVIYDTLFVEKSVDNLTRILANKGYVHAQVTPEVKKRNKKAKVKYQIQAGNPYRIAGYTINISDSALDNPAVLGALQRNRQEPFDLNRILMRNTLIKPQSVFDLNLLDDERERVSSVLRRFGYYDFNKEYIGFVADTAVGKDLVGLELTVYPIYEGMENEASDNSSHKQYVVKDVSFYMDYNPLEDGDISGYMATDTVYRANGDYRIYYGKRGNYINPYVITNACHIVPGMLYSENAASMTYNSLYQLHILRNVNIRYEKFMENDSVKLRCIITCIPDKKQGMSAEIEGTNSDGQFGVGAGVGYTHRNIFKGSELFNAKVQGSYEALGPSFSSFDQNYFEIGGEVSVSFPRFMFPFLSSDFRKSIHASTQFAANFFYQRRPEYFTRTVLSSRISYSWQGRRNSPIKHKIDLIDVSYIHIPEISTAFSLSLTEAALRYSFTDQFILSSGYTFIHSNYNSSDRLGLFPSHSLKASVETAGNALSLLAAMTNIEKYDEDGKKIFNTRYSQYALGNVDYSRTIPFDDRNSLAWRLGGGVVFPYGNNRIVPIQKRFFSGGANSVRGWQIRELGPGSFNREGATFYDQSGDIRLDANIEYRSKVFWKLELAAFLDAGNIWTIREYERQKSGSFKLNSFYREIAAAWGLGVRLDLDFVLLRLDCGWKVYNPASRYKEPDLTSGSGVEYISGTDFRWPVLKPFDFKQNTAWHIAVGYPF
ncbi:MAG: outer membrane protein assembly factor [Prevotella sp.]|nr:outer membrane protein assembly factor [Prevotella sp.]